MPSLDFEIPDVALEPTWLDMLKGKASARRDDGDTRVNCLLGRWRYHAIHIAHNAYIKLQKMREYKHAAGICAADAVGIDFVGGIPYSKSWSQSAPISMNTPPLACRTRYLGTYLSRYTSPCSMTRPPAGCSHGTTDQAKWGVYLGTVIF